MDEPCVISDVCRTCVTSCERDAIHNKAHGENSIFKCFITRPSFKRSNGLGYVSKPLEFHLLFSHGRQAVAG
jgi:hypothetical protein